MKLVLPSFFAICVVSSLALGADPTTDDAATLRAENRMLRSQVAQQQKQIAELQAQLKKLGASTEVSRTATTMPTATVRTLPLAGAAHVSSGRTRSVVFAIEGRGMMLNRIGDIRKEVVKAVQNLSADQRFDIIVINDRHVAMMSTALERAGIEAIGRADRFLNGIAPRGESNPLSMLIDAAAKLDPDQVWLIADPDVQEPKQEYLKVLASRGSHRFAINTIFYPLYDDDRADPGVLAELSEKTGGVCMNGVTGHVAKSDPEKRPVNPVAKPLPKGPSIFDLK